MLQSISLCKIGRNFLISITFVATEGKLPLAPARVLSIASRANSKSPTRSLANQNDASHLHQSGRVGCHRAKAAKGKS